MVKPFFLFSQSKVQVLKCTLCPQLGGLWAWFEVKLNFLLSVTHVVDCALYVHDIFVASIKSILIKRPSGMSGGPIISYWGNLAATNLPFPSSTLKTTQFSFFDIQTPWPCKHKHKHLDHSLTCLCQPNSTKPPATPQSPQSCLVTIFAAPDSRILLFSKLSVLNHNEGESTWLCTSMHRVQNEPFADIHPRA